MRSRPHCPGSITYYLSLIMLVMLALIFAGLSSVRQAAARTVIASAAEQALFSEFAGYDRKLYDQYGLLFINGGFGDSSFRPDILTEEISEYAEYITDPAKGNPGGRGVIGIDLKREKTALTGYVLATDADGAAFMRQVCDTMRAELGGAALKRIKRRLMAEEHTRKTIQKGRRGITSEKSDRYYAEDQAANGEKEKENDIKPAAENPIENVRLEKRKGILRLAVPADLAVSGSKAELKQMISQRQLHQGFGMIPSAEEEGDAKILMIEYLADNFPCFTDKSGDAGLKYQMEYAIGGKNSDRENLTSVVHYLITMREASNLVYLMSDPAKRSEANSLAAGIAALLLIPEAVPLISFILKTIWAYGESVLDVRELLDGGRIPLVKDAESWQLQLSNLGKLSGAADGDRHSSRNGIEYKEYLRLLLLSKTQKTLAFSLMDLTEYNLRLNESSFRLDNCVDALRVLLTADTGRKEFTAEKSYGYDE